MPTVEEILAELTAQGFGDCLAGAPEFTTAEEIFDYIVANCDLPTGWGDDDSTDVDTLGHGHGNGQHGNGHGNGHGWGHGHCGDTDTLVVDSLTGGNWHATVNRAIHRPTISQGQGRNKTNEANAFVMDVMPNPAKEYIVVRAEEAVSSYGIFTLTGQKVLGGTTTGTEVVVQLNDLPEGIYFVRLQTLDNRVATQRFMLVK